MRDKKYPEMSVEEFNMTVTQLSKVYDIVRAVDVSRQQVITFNEDGSRMIDDRHHCFEAWNQNGRCQNCISAMAFRQKNRLSKFEFIDHTMFHVTSQFITVNNEPCIMEIVEEDPDETITGAFGEDEFITQVKEYSSRVYTDSLTRVSNRRYFDEQLSGLEMDAVVMIDVDNFKDVNDTYGHLCGDEVLHTIAKTIRQNISNVDSVVRYGGDEFFVAFSLTEPELLQERMETLRSEVEKLTFQDYPNLKISISIGGVYGRANVTEMLAAADEELYRAKKTKNQFCMKQFNA